MSEVLAVKAYDTSSVYEWPTIVGVQLTLSPHKRFRFDPPDLDPTVTGFPDNSDLDFVEAAVRRPGIVTVE